MARLLDLPDEIILLIAEYLQATNQQTALWFYELAEAYDYAIDVNPPQSVKSLHSLLLASSRLNNLLTPVFYRDVFVRRDPYDDKTPPLEMLKRSVQQDPSLSEYIISASFRGETPRHGSIRDAIPFFWFPNIQTLTIYDFDEREPQVFVTDSHIGTSPVTRLSLLECSANEDALAEVLSWSAALQILHFDAGTKEPDPGYYGNDDDVEPEEWDAAAFVRALQSQKTTLEELILTHPEEVLPVAPINLVSFGVLKTLRIYQSFLAGLEYFHTVWEYLPPNLEVLEVFNNDDYFLDDDPDEPYELPLHDLITDKRTHFPHLHSVTIYSRETAETADGYGTGWTEHLPELWPLPSSLASAAEAAGIKLVVWLEPREGPNFEDLDFDVVQSLKASQNDQFTRTRRRGTTRYPAPQLQGLS